MVGNGHNEFEQANGERLSNNNNKKKQLKIPVHADIKKQNEIEQKNTTERRCPTLSGSIITNI